MSLDELDNKKRKLSDDNDVEKKKKNKKKKIEKYNAGSVDSMIDELKACVDDVIPPMNTRKKLSLMQLKQLYELLERLELQDANGNCDLDKYDCLIRLYNRKIIDSDMKFAHKLQYFSFNDSLAEYLDEYKPSSRYIKNSAEIVRYFPIEITLKNLESEMGCIRGVGKSVLKAMRAHFDFVPPSSLETIEQAPAPPPQVVEEEEVKDIEIENVKEATTITKAPEYKLSSEQQYVYDLVVNQKQNVFITGRAGTGKSFLLNAIIRDLRGTNVNVAVTASTGIAAVSLGGTTLHYFASIGLGEEKVSVLIAKIKNMKKSYERWNTTQVLIIDEISMINAKLFDKLDKIGRSVRGRHDQPFGGLQIIACGDFLQLPPVSRNPAEKIMYAFTSPSWNECFPYQIVLCESFRQKNQDFINCLNQCRLGFLSEEHEEMLKARLINSDDDEKNDDDEDGDARTFATRLYPHRKKVEQINNEELKRLKGKTGIYRSIGWSDGTEDGRAHLGRLYRNCPAPKDLEIRKGARVMLLKNLDFDRHLVNGTCGIVTGFYKNDSSFLKRKKEGDDDDEEEDVYNEKVTVAKVNEDFSGTCKDAPYLPIVKFNNGQILKIRREEWEVKVDNDTVASLSQLPLMLSWAATIHRSQGSTLDSAQMSLSESFAPGQVYVALSRLRKLEGLLLESFNIANIFADELAILYYECLHIKNDSGDKSFAERRQRLNSSTQNMSPNDIINAFEERKRQYLEEVETANNNGNNNNNNRFNNNVSRSSDFFNNKNDNINDDDDDDDDDDDYRECEGCGKYNIPSDSESWKKLCLPCFRNKRSSGGGNNYNNSNSSRNKSGGYRECEGCGIPKIPASAESWKRLCFQCYRNSRNTNRYF